MIVTKTALGVPREAGLMLHLQECEWNIRWKRLRDRDGMGDRGDGCGRRF